MIWHISPCTIDVINGEKRTFRSMSQPSCGSMSRFDEICDPLNLKSWSEYSNQYNTCFPPTCPTCIVIFNAAIEKARGES